MSLSKLFLALLLLFMAAGWLGWFTVDAVFMGVLALLTSILLFVEGTPVVYERVRR